MNLLIQLAKEGGIAWAILIAILAFNAGMQWVTYQYLKNNAVTKKDLKIDQLSQDQRLQDRFDSRYAVRPSK